jgi:hypothetical protein
MGTFLVSTSCSGWSRPTLVVAMLMLVSPSQEPGTVRREGRLLSKEAF